MPKSSNCEEGNIVQVCFCLFCWGVVVFLCFFLCVCFYIYIKQTDRLIHFI